MEKISHALLIVDLVNRLAAWIAASLGIPVENPAQIVPDYLVMCMVIVAVVLALGLFVRSRLSVERPGKTQIVLEDLISLRHRDVEGGHRPEGHPLSWPWSRRSACSS